VTKEELLRALEPFTSDLEIMIGSRGRWYEVDNAEYATRFSGDGCLVLNLGAQILLRTRPAKDAP
jgi:hypothetical protein